jgi:hypothetical protein
VIDEITKNPGCWLRNSRAVEARPFRGERQGEPGLGWNTAIERAQHEIFDAALLISTGEEMDLAETVFNLSDVSGAMELIILSDQTNTASSAISKELLAELVSSASVMTTQDLQSRFKVVRKEER